MALARVTVDPAQMGGVPDDVLADYPYLEREDITAALEYAAAKTA